MAYEYKINVRHDMEILAGNLKKVNDDNIYDIYAKTNKLIRF